MADFYALPDEEDGIREITPDTDFGIDTDFASAGKTVREVQYFNLNGQKITNQIVNGKSSNSKPLGIIIRKEIYDDGTFSSKKIRIGDSN